jgi:hypothetical protein
MKKIINFIKSLKFIFMPRYWLMLEGYDAAWDKKFQELAEKHDFVTNCEDGEPDNLTFTAFLGDYRIWVGNYPYAFFRYSGKRDESFETHDVRPSRLTIHKYYKKLVNDLAKHNCKHR